MTALRRQASQMRLDLDKKKIVGPLPAGEPATTEKALADLDVKIAQTQAGNGVAVPPDTMNLRAVWPAGRDQRPWPATDGPALAAQAKTFLAVAGHRTGHRRLARGLDRAVQFHREPRARHLAGAGSRPTKRRSFMAEASDAWREGLLGRPWAGLKLKPRT